MRMVTQSGRLLTNTNLKGRLLERESTNWNECNSLNHCGTLKEHSREARPTKVLQRALFLFALELQFCIRFTTLLSCNDIISSAIDNVIYYTKLQENHDIS